MSQKKLFSLLLLFCFVSPVLRAETSSTQELEAKQSVRSPIKIYLRSCLTAVKAALAAHQDTAPLRTCEAADPTMKKPDSVASSFLVIEGDQVVALANTTSGEQYAISTQQDALKEPAPFPFPEEGKPRPHMMGEGCQWFWCCHNEFCCFWIGKGSPICHGI